MKVISAHLSETNQLPLYSQFDLLHDVLVEINNRIYFLEIKAKDTIEAAHKVLRMTENDIVQNIKSNLDS